jgi:hypothetical protein
MYPLENQVIPLHQARKLKKLGVECESFWVWWDERGMEPRVNVRVPIVSKYADQFPAFTVSELGMMLPVEISVDMFKYHVHFVKSKSGFRVKYRTFMSGTTRDIFHTDTLPTEAEARGAALIWLIQEGHIKPEDL